MFHARMTRTGLMAAIVIFLLVSAAQGAQASSKRSDGRTASAATTVTVGTNPNLLTLPVFIADQLGYFAKQGINIKYETVVNPGPPLINGDVDVDATATDTAIELAAQGQYAPAIVALQQRNSLVLAGRSDEHWPHAKDGAGWPGVMKDLRKGAVIGVSVRAGGIASFLNGLFAKSTGLVEGRDFTITVLGTPQAVISALVAKRIDAGVLFAPWDGEAFHIKAAVPLVEEAKGQPPGVGTGYGVALLANKSFLANNPKTAKGVVTAIKQAEAYFQAYLTNLNIYNKLKVERPKTKKLKLARIKAMHKTKQIYTGHKAVLEQIGVKFAGDTAPKVIDGFLKEGASLAHPEMTCKRLKGEINQLFATQTIKTKPTCAQVADFGLIPKSG